MAQDIESIGLSMDTSGVEKGIKSLETLAATGPKVERAMGGVEGAAAKTGKTLENLGQGRAATSLNKVGEAAGGAAREMGRVNQASDQVSRGLSGMASNADLAAKAIASIGIAASVQQYLRVADAVTALNNSLKLSTGSVQSASAAYEDLFQIAQRSRVGFLQLGETYSSISRATGELGVSQARMLKVTESIANAMTIGGGSAQSMNAALVQLGQGLASGTLRGEELNSILEQAPRLAKALADGLGVPIGKLRELGAAGEITSQQIVKALESQSAVLSKEVTGATITLGQAFTQLTNSGTKAVGEFDKASGASTTLAQAISSVAKSMDNLGTSFQNNAGTIQTVMGALAGATALTALAAIPRAIAAVTGAVSGLAAVLAANPVVLTLLGVGAAVGGGLAAVNAYSKTAEGIKSAVRSLEEANQRSEAAMQRALDGGRSAGADNIRKTIEERKKAIRDLNAELALMSNTSLDNRAEEARLAAGTEQYRAQQRAAEELAGIKQKLSGVDKDYLPTLNKLFRQYQDGNITLKEYQSLVGKLAADNYKPEKQADGIKAAQSAYEALISSIRAKIAADKQELSGGSALTESQRMRIKLDEDMAAGRVKLGAAQALAVRFALQELQATESAVAAAKILAKGNLEAAQAREKYLNSLGVGTEKIQADIQAQIEATARMGLSKEAVAALDAAKLEMLATDLELQAIRALDRNQDQQTYDALKQQAALYRELAQAKKDGVAKEMRLEMEKASQEAAKDATREWQRAADEINRSLTDALLRGFESGKGFAKNFVDTMKNMFSTLVLRPIISAVVNPVAGAITGALGLAGTANAAASGASTLGGIGNIASLGSNLFSSGLGSTISGAIGSGVGALFGTTAGNAALGTSLGLGAGSATAAAAAAAQAGGASAAAAASAASTGASIAGALPYIGAAVAALSLLAGKFSGETRTGGQFGVAFDGSVTNQRRDQTYTIEGQQFDRDFTNGLQTALKDGIAYRLEGDPVAQESAIREAVAGTASGINGFLKALGSAATLTGFSAGLETSGKGRGGVFAGGLLSTGAAFGESGKGDNYAGTLYEKFSTNSPDFKTALENFTLDLKQSTIQALQTVSDIPQAVQKMLQGVDAEALTEDAANKLLETINAQIVGVENLRTSFENIGLDKLAEMSFDAASGLAAAAGGFDALQGKLATYYDAFYTEEEKRANTIRQITKTLRDAGAQVTADDVGKATREQFRAIYESIVDVGGAADPVAVALLNVAGAFASVTPAAEDAAKAAKELADAQVRSAEQAAQEAARRAEEVARERAGLESQLLQLLGNTTALRERELEALDASNRALQEHIYAVEDARAAYQKSVEGAQGAYNLLDRSVAAERKAADDAFSAQKAALQKESSAKLDALQSQVQSAKEAADRIRGIANSLAGALRSVRVESPQLDFARLTGARATVSGAAAGGNIFASGLESALSVVSEDNRRFYGRFEDFAFAQGVTAGEVAKLNDSAKAQLSAAEAIAMGVQAQIDVEKMLAETQLAAMQAGYDAQIARLDDSLELGKSQLDALLGIDNSVVSVQEALDRLTGAVNASNAALQAQKAAEAAAAMAVAGGSSPGAGSLQESLWAAQEAALTARLSDPEYLKSLGFNESQIKEAKAGAESWPSTLNMANRLSETLGAIKGVSGTQLIEDAAKSFRESGSALFDMSGINFGGSGYVDPEKMRELERLLGVDGSHAGGLAYVPFDGYRAELHKGERVLTQDEARVYTPSAYQMSIAQNGASNAEIAAALRAMAARLDAIEANTRSTAGHTAGTYRQISRVVRNDAIATEVQPA